MRTLSHINWIILSHRSIWIFHSIGQRANFCISLWVQCIQYTYVVPCSLYLPTFHVGTSTARAHSARHFVDFVATKNCVGAANIHINLSHALLSRMENTTGVSGVRSCWQRRVDTVQVGTGNLINCATKQQTISFSHFSPFYLSQIPFLLLHFLLKYRFLCKHFTCRYSSLLLSINSIYTFKLTWCLLNKCCNN